MQKIATLFVLTIGLIINPVLGYPYAGDDYRYLDRDYASPGAHQLASWIASQLRPPKELIPPQEVPILPYRLPLQGKRNSEVSNAIIGSEETQKLYRDGRK
ncbi:hypothetical protein Zmor_026107 [Zophobas morio]|uniref:Uncharacterized protein n=2 Tax=Zophobas TaxID=7073 RepID=A0AA38HY97_9CUCU|nr:hypothetical protein Zmor_026107 [Zophobas morio]UXO98091.1 pigment dispersing factor [Zophobas atratus]